mgnify:CR=1 FL=1
MALLCAGIDKNIIKLVGRWASDCVFRYLHAHAEPLVRNLARKMLIYGDYTLLPGSDLPPRAQQVAAQAFAALAANSNAAYDGT